MATQTLAEYELELAQVKSYIADIFSGKRFQQLIVGSGNFQRKYTYDAKILETLLQERTRLQGIVDAMQPTESEVTPVFVTGYAFTNRVT